MQANNPAVKKKEVKSPICVFPPIPSSKGIANPAAAVAGSISHPKHVQSMKSPTIPDNILATIFFLLFLLKISS
jgi:hypothetical protein